MWQEMRLKRGPAATSAEDLGATDGSWSWSTCVNDQGPRKDVREQHVQLDLHLRKVTLAAEWKAVWGMGEWGGWREDICRSCLGFCKQWLYCFSPLPLPSLWTHKQKARRQMFSSLDPADEHVTKLARTLLLPVFKWPPQQQAGWEFNPSQTSWIQSRDDAV